MATKVDYAKTGLNVLKLVGGEENVRSLAHCATRLRFKLKDESLARTDEIEGLDGVVAVMQAGGQYQVVIGNDVPIAYKGITDHSKLGRESSSDDETDTPKGSLLNRFIELISSIFLPILWTLAGAGLVKAFTALAVTLGFDETSQSYIILNAIGDSIINFLPFAIAITAAKRFRANQFTSLAIAGILLYPDLIALNNAKDPVYFFGIPVIMVSYISSVIPMILAVWLQGMLERWLNRVLPSAIRNFTTPMITIPVIGLATLLTVGPATTFLSTLIASAVTSVWSVAPWLAGGILGGFWQVLTIFGLHWGLVPVMVNNLTTLGHDVMAPAIFAPVLAQGAAALAVFFKTRNQKLRQVAGPSALSGILAGITEPAIYGVNLPLKKPFIFGCIGGALGGALAAAGGASSPSFLVPSGLTLVAFIGAPASTMMFIGVLLAMVFAFIATYFFGVPASNEESKSTADIDLESVEEEAIPTPHIGKDQKIVPANARIVPANATVVLPAEGENTTDLVAAASGETIPLADINDPVFSSGAMGQGLGIKPEEDTVYSPISGKILTALDTGHAYGIRSETGVEVLVHIGIDTVQMKGAGFQMHATKGDRVKVGQPLVTFDRKAVKDAGYDNTVIIIVTNSGNFATVQPRLGQHLSAGELAVIVER